MAHTKFQKTLRRCMQNKTYFFISLGGLALSLTVTLLMYSFIVKEIQIDRFHQNGDDIYRVLIQRSSTDELMPGTCEPLAPEAQSQVPGIKSYSRLYLADFAVKTNQAEDFGQMEHCIHSDASFFTLFTFPITNGTISSQSPKDWAVISQKAASQYFGKENPIGQIITLQNRQDFHFPTPREYQIVAVMQDIPDCSTLQADFILDYQKIAGFSDWNNNYELYTYVQLEKNAQPKKIAVGIGKVFKDNMNHNGDVSLQPLNDIYFNRMNVYTATWQTLLPQGSITFTRMLSCIALLILFLSICNYLMIKMAQSQRHQENYAIQRCFGADNRILRLQVLKETSFIFLLAGILAVILTIWLFPTFREIVSPYYVFSFPLSSGSIGMIIAIIGIIMLVISHTLSQHTIHRLNNQGIKGSIQPVKSTFDLKQVLMTAQIAIFCALLVCTSIISKQMHYLETKDIGYNRDNLISIIGESRLKPELLRNPDILSVAVGHPLPQYGNLYFNLACQFDNKRAFEASSIGGDADYLDTYQIPLLEGENFDKNATPKRSGVIPVIVNQEFVKKAGLQHPLGTIFYEEDEPQDSFQIIGIVQDFNVYSLYRPISPLVLFYSTGPSTGCRNTGELTLRYRENTRAETIKYLEQMNISSFSEYDNSRLYGKEKAFIRLIDICTYIAIFLGGLGIFAFAVFMAANRKKEVALRKINGASEKDIHLLLNRLFIRSTLYACVVALPLSFYFMAFWLEKFAYRVSLEWWFFPLIIGISILFVTLVIYWQVRKIVRINPVECLHED